MGEDIGSLQKGGNVWPCLRNDEMVHVEQLGDAAEGRIANVGWMF